MQLASVMPAQAALQRAYRVHYTYEPCEDVDPMPDYENVLND